MFKIHKNYNNLLYPIKKNKIKFLFTSHLYLQQQTQLENIISYNYINSLLQKLKYLKNNNNKLKQEFIKLQFITQQEIEKNKRFALEKLIIELLPIIDNLERTISIKPTETEKNNNFLTIMYEGIHLTLLSFIKILKKLNLKIINTNNIPFDPQIHQAISLINNSKIPNNQVVMIMQKGYKLHNRLLRPAMVTVNRLN